MAITRLINCSDTLIIELPTMCVVGCRFDAYNEWRMKLGECKALERIKCVMNEFCEVLKEDERKYKEKPELFDFGKLKYPYWMCQPYVRPE